MCIPFSSDSESRTMVMRSLSLDRPVSQSCAVDKRDKFCLRTTKQSKWTKWTKWTKWKTVPLAKVQLCENENQILEAFFAVSRLYAKFGCPVARQKFLYFTCCA